jgi:Fe-S oxidoreductase
MDYSQMRVKDREWLFQRVPSDEESQRKIIDACIRVRGIDWMVGAMVEGSIGYHSPKGALMIIRQYLKGETKSYCERCYALHNSNLIEMLAFDCMTFLRKMTMNLEGAKNVVAYCQKVGSLSDEHQEMLGLMYPTIGL